MSATANSARPIDLATGSWTIEPGETAISFSIKKMMIWTVNGSFKLKSGTIDVADPVGDSTVSLVIDASSFDTPTEMRDKHVKSDDFLDVARFPEITFESTSVRAASTGWDVTGNLTVAGQSRQMELNVQPRGQVSDNQLQFYVSTIVKRGDFGVGKMKPMVSDDLHVEITGVATR